MVGAPQRIRVLLLTAALLSLVSPGVQARPTVLPTAPSVHVQQDSVTGTVRSVRETGIEVITGVQFALRLTYIAVDSTTAIRKEGSSVTLSTLKPGDLVTVRYRATDEGMVAEVIRVEAGREGGGR